MGVLTSVRVVCCVLILPEAADSMIQVRQKNGCFRLPLASVNTLYQAKSNEGMQVKFGTPLVF
jgi:hypothetical protein